MGHVCYQNFNKVFHFLFYCISCLFCRCTLFSLYFLTSLSSVLKLLLRSSRTLHCPFPSQKETLKAVQSSTCMCCCPADFLLGTANSMEIILRYDFTAPKNTLLLHATVSFREQVERYTHLPSSTSPYSLLLTLSPQVTPFSGYTSPTLPPIHCGDLERQMSLCLRRDRDLEILNYTFPGGLAVECSPTVMAGN